MNSSESGEATTDPMLGKTVGPYRLVRKLGQGGMGAVYEAVHLQLGRPTAVKLLLRELLSSADAASRFFNEAKAVSTVSHPSLVTIYDHGQSSEGESYIAMELLDGVTLRERQEQRYLGRSALPLIRQLASALAATHKKRIIHRDLKPENIMLVADAEAEGGERAKILDFGIAKLLSEGVPEKERRLIKTRTGSIIGTPTYMSPEQCRASTPADEKSDVYSLGVIFYELLYGEPLFMSESAGELFAMHMYAAPRELATLVPKVNPEVAALIGRMLAKAPASRPTMEQLVTELAALRTTGLADGPLAQRPSLSRANGKRTGETLDAALVISAELAKVMEPGGPTPTGSGAGQVRSSTNPRRARLPVLLAAAAVVAGLVALWSATRPPSSMPKQLAATPALPGAPGPAGVVVRGAAPPDGGSQLKPPPVVVTAPPTDPSGVPASPTAPMDPAANPGSTKEGKRAGKSPRKAVRGPKSEHDKEPEKDNEKEKYKIDLWQ